MSYIKQVVAALMLLIVLIAACNPTGGTSDVDEARPTATPEAVDAGDAAVAAAVAHLARELGVAEAEIEVVSFEQTEFSDSCLGLGGPAESCLQVITPGWLIMLSVQGQVYEVHTDESGQNVRVAGESADVTQLPEAIQAAVWAQVAQILGLGDVEIEVISVEQTEFSDGCLGLGGPAESCLQVITPGWLIMLSVQGQVYEVHTDESGEQVRIAGESAGTPGLPVHIEAAAVAQLAQKLGVAETEIEVISFEQTEFSDGCLGLGGPAESCLQVITPGWLVMLGAQGEVYEVHTDESGEQVRIAGESAGTAGLPVHIEAAAVAYLAQELGVAESEIEVISFEHTEFSDGCLGLGGPAESCLQAITPGWLVMLGAQDEVYEVHTDESGEQVRIAGESAGSTAPPVDMQGAAVYYEVSGGVAGGLDRYFIYEDGSVEKHIGPPGSEAPIMLYEVDPTRVARLIADLGKAGFFELDGDYLPEELCCDRRTFVISAALGEQSNMIQTMDGVEDLPLGVTESLRLLQEFVDELAAGTSG